MKAIDTRYKGYKFRSRLEARWAVFFDSLGLEWQYEPEGFDLGKEVGYYLPDFYITTWGAWVEIKPTFPNEAERSRMWALSCDSRKTGLILIGDNFAEVGCLEFFPSHISELKEDWKDMIRECCQAHVHDNGNLMLVNFYILKASDPEFMQAHLNARSARFEHGETPSF